MQLPNPVIPDFNYTRVLPKLGITHVERFVIPTGVFELEYRYCSYRHKGFFLIKGKQRKRLL